jgi:hypothetical protein
MTQQSSAALANFSSNPMRSPARPLWNRVGNWFNETRWNERGILVCVAELALAALSFLSAASFFPPSNAGELSAGLTLIFLPLTLVLRGIAFQSFGVSDRSFRHAGLADVIAIGKSMPLARSGRL